MVFYEKKSFAFYSIACICSLLLTIGVAICAGIREGWILAVGVLICMGFIPMILGIVAWISYRRRLVIKEDGITFYYKLFSSTKKYNGYNRKGLHIRYDEIKSFSRIPRPGDHVLTEDCYRYFLKLSDGATIELWLHGMRKEDEDYIVDVIREHIKQ